MSILAMSLLVTTALALFIPLVRRLAGGLPRWLDFVPAFLVALMIVHIVVDGLQAHMVFLYAVVVLLFLFTLGRLIRPDRPTKASRWRTVLTLAGAVVGIVGLIAGIWSAPMAATAAGEDLSRQSWTAAFERMNEILAQRYGFTEWKQIDWDALHAEFAPRIAAAEEANDRDAYYLALREYFFSIPDGHMIFSGDDLGFWRESIGGGYGLAVIELDDGSVIAHVLQEGGPAEEAGMAWGAEILEWDGVPAREAIGAVSPIWAELPPATQEGRRLLQQALLARAPIGTEIALTFQNPGESVPRTVTLAAIDDGLEPLYRSLSWRAGLGIKKGVGDRGEEGAGFLPPEYKLLPEGYGYIKIYHVRPGQDDPDFVEIVDRAVAEFIARDVRGIIVDVRGNPGGEDTLVPRMMSHFFAEPDFYEYMHVGNWPTRVSLFDFNIPLGLEPREPHFGGPVAVLIDGDTRSSGEGFPFLARRLPQGHVVGVYGTHGSFGMCCGHISLPGEYELLYPIGQSHDAEHRVLLDGDQNLQGGVAPDVRVPLTRETVHAMFVANKDVVLQYAIDALEAY